MYMMKVYLTYGSYIYIIRRDFIKKISDIANAMHTKLTNGIEDLQITYKNQMNISDEDTVIDVKERFLIN